MHFLRACPISIARVRDHNRRMSLPELESYSIGEFVTYKLTKDPSAGTFTITLTGELKHALLIAHKVANLTISEAELAELEVPLPTTATP